MEESLSGFLLNGFSTNSSLLKQKTCKKIYYTTNNKSVGIEIPNVTYVNQVVKKATAPVNLSTKSKPHKKSTASIPMATSPLLSSRLATTRKCKKTQRKTCGTINRTLPKTPRATSTPASAKVQISKKTIVKNGLLPNGFVSPLSQNKRKLLSVKSKTLSCKKTKSQSSRKVRVSSKKLSTHSAPAKKTKSNIHKTKHQKTTMNKQVSENKRVNKSLRKNLSEAAQFRKKVKSNLKMQKTVALVQSTRRSTIKYRRRLRQSSLTTGSVRPTISEIDTSQFQELTVDIYQQNIISENKVTNTPPIGDLNLSPTLPTMITEPLTPAETPVHTADTDLPLFLKEQVNAIKCPPFCNTRCTSIHSKLLFALLNCDDHADNFKESVSFKYFLNTINYYQKKNWRKNSAIFDVNPEYRYPLIHWAAILSKLNIMKWMASAGYNINVLHTSTGDTALHRVFLCIRAIRRNNPVMLEKFPQILEILEPNLKIKNRAGLTPFLRSCETVGMDGRSHYRNVDLLRETLNFAKQRPGLLNILLNQQTKQGQSALHLLALNDKALGALKMLLTAGANVQCLNKQGQTPFSLAVSLGQLRVAQYLEKHPLNITTPCIDTPLSSAPSSRASSSNSPSESNGDHLNPHEAADAGPNAVSPTSNAASDTDTNTPPLSKRIKVEGSLPGDYESDVSENTVQYNSSREYPSKVKHVMRKCSNNSCDGILKQYFHICNDSARENLIASINIDKDQCLQELKVTEERLAALSRQIESICTEKHKKETEIRRLMMEMKVFDQSLEKLKEEKQELTEKSSSLDAKISLCVSVLKIVHNKNT